MYALTKMPRPQDGFSEGGKGIARPAEQCLQGSIVEGTVPGLNITLH